MQSDGAAPSGVPLYASYFWAMPCDGPSHADRMATVIASLIAGDFLVTAIGRSWRKKNNAYSS
jgi:hypothetical protein